MNRTVIAGIMTWINFATLSFLFLIFSWFAALLGLMAFFEGDSSFKKTWTTKTKKGTSKQNISQISMNFKYAVCGSDWEMLWYIVYMTSMIVRESELSNKQLQETKWLLIKTASIELNLQFIILPSFKWTNWFCIQKNVNETVIWLFQRYNYQTCARHIGVGEVVQVDSLKCQFNLNPRSVMYRCHRVVINLVLHSKVNSGHLHSDLFLNIWI